MLRLSLGYFLDDLKKIGAPFVRQLNEAAATLTGWMQGRGNQRVVDEAGNFIEGKRRRFLLTSSLIELMKQGGGFQELLGSELAVRRIVERFTDKLAQIEHMSAWLTEPDLHRQSALSMAIMAEHTALIRHWDGALAQDEVVTVYNFETDKIEAVIRNEWEAVMEERILAGMGYGDPHNLRTTTARQIYDSTVQAYGELEAWVFFKQQNQSSLHLWMNIGEQINDLTYAEKSHLVREAHLWLNSEQVDIIRLEEYVGVETLRLMEELVALGNPSAVPSPDNWLDEDDWAPTYLSSC